MNIFVLCLQLPAHSTFLKYLAHFFIPVMLKPFSNEKVVISQKEHKNGIIILMSCVLLYSFLQVDPFHTLFGIAGLSLLGESGLKRINPVFCMPQHIIDRLGIKVQTLSL